MFKLWQGVLRVATIHRKRLPRRDSVGRQNTVSVKQADGLQIPWGYKPNFRENKVWSWDCISGAAQSQLWTIALLSARDGVYCETYISRTALDILTEYLIY